jgi:hypothetical protein
MGLRSSCSVERPESARPGLSASLLGTYPRPVSSSGLVLSWAKDDLQAGLRAAVSTFDLAFSSLVLAGQRGRDLFAFAEARQHFERAAELRPQVSAPVAGDAPPTWELLRNAALCARYSGDSRGAAVSHLRRAISVLGEDNDPGSLGGLWAELSESYWMRRGCCGI